MAELSEIDWNKYIGRKLGDNFTLIYKLGQGAMGAVFVGYQHSLKRQVAIKVIPKLNSAGYRQELFRDEAEAVAVLTHPNIVPIYEIGESGELYYQVMQLVQGKDLRSILQQQKLNPVPSKRLFALEKTIKLILQMLEGLDYAHEQGVVHQDIKPANLLIEERSDRLLIADFGICRAIGAEYKAQGRIVGTAQYMAPEQAQCFETDGRADIYSVGIVFFELVNGFHPFKNETSEDVLLRKRLQPKSCDELIESQLTSNKAIPADVCSIICRATSADKDSRYSNCADFKKELISFLQSLQLKNNRQRGNIL